MKTIDALKSARAKVAQGWCQGDFAVNHDGLRVPTSSKYACAWCIVGAVNSACGIGDPYDLREGLRNTLSAVAGTENIPAWNDAPGRTQKEVLALFDRAIQAEEGK